GGGRMTRRKHILVVIPAHNEAANLPVVVEELRRARTDCDALVVDDGSIDGTAELAERLGLTVIRHFSNRGYGAALASGYRHAVENGYRIVVQCDADGQHDPAQIERLLEALARGCDVAVGSRMPTPNYRPSLPRKMGIRFFAWLGRTLTGRSVTDPTSGFAAMNRRAAELLMEVVPDDFPDLYVRLLLHRGGFVVREVPVVMRRRLSGKSMTDGLVPFVYVPKMMVYVGRACARPVRLRHSRTSPPAVGAGCSEGRRVLLANPPTGLYIREDRCQSPVKGISASLRFPIDLAYMAATCRQQGAVPCVRDYPAEGGTAEDFADDLHRFRPQVVVLSTISPTLEWDLEYCRIAKRIDPSIVTVVKGAHVTAQSGQILERNDALDAVICGESEIAAAEIAAGTPLSEIRGLAFRTASGIRTTPPRPTRADTDGLPFPARDLTRNELYVRPDTRRPQTTIQTGWGCPYGCTYCLAPQVSGRKLRSRSPENVVAEIRECVELHEIRDFYFRADTFTLDRRWVAELCHAILRSGLPVSWGCNSRVDTVDPETLRLMRKAGCWIIGFGVESGSDEILARIGKGATVEQARRAVRMCGEAGIKPYAFFMLGFPWETEQTAAQTLELIRTIGADFIEMNVPVPFPGTQIAEEAERAGLIEAPLLGHDHSKPMIRPHTMTRRRVAELWRKGLLTFYLRPSHAWRLLKETDSPGDALNYLTWGGRFLHRLLAGDDPD
ncbi:MAG: glycosyltransferase, partial [Myxococcota bacterium]|nr:glycosyltransferase [Myxococcota bacterium]